MIANSTLLRMHLKHMTALSRTTQRMKNRFLNRSILLEIGAFNQTIHFSRLTLTTDLRIISEQRNLFP